MQLILKTNNNEYCDFLKQMLAAKEEMQSKHNSVYEFRMLHGFDQFYQEELTAMLQHIKNNKLCKTTEDHRFRASDQIIVQKLDQMSVLNSSAIMLDSRYIDQVKHFCQSAQMSFLVWDSRLISTYKSRDRQELISRLNSVDLVIMDGKESSKITAFLANNTQLINLPDEIQALQELLKIVGNEKYKSSSETAELVEKMDQIKHSLHYLIARNNDPFMHSSELYRCFYMTPKALKVSGLSFQRFVLVPGSKPLQKPIFSKCSWVFSTLKDGQQQNLNYFAPFLKKLEPLGLFYNAHPISIQGYKFLSNQILNRHDIHLECREYRQKSTLLTLKYKHKVALSHFLDSRSFQVLPFELFHIKGTEAPQDSINPFKQADIQLSSPLKKIKAITLNNNKYLNPNLEQIIKEKLSQACEICYIEEYTTKFVFGCCGCSISTNCLINGLKSQGVVKCPSCRTELDDNSVDMGFFISLDPASNQNDPYYKDFNHCYRLNRNPELDSFVYGAGARMEPGQFIPSDGLFRSQKCQLFICIDYVCPDINFLIIEHDTTQEYVKYHIQRIIYQQIGKSNYKSIQVILYSANSAILKYLNKSCFLQQQSLGDELTQIQTLQLDPQDKANTMSVNQYSIEISEL